MYILLKRREVNKMARCSKDGGKLWRLTVFMTGNENITADFDNPDDAIDTAFELMEKDNRIIGYRIRPIKEG
ncbi:hypothetical protein QSE64_001080 [Escherichia coli]|uniref:hypothetical protein n=1 Tax=Escherichia coli TaxID=562 RepID=UPI0010CC2326|nr:hypothetical protein [Escherichia coli]EEW1027233.1 hypothetical protein [Escherichia coli]EFL1942335.1 hypothetical protein [Escherichia coli]EHR9386976.1 hypothetical protein [Escherichia coli]EHZ0689422.1 hypothetical protein [Escherichia coli]EKH4525236.1 hypothetical protein [Escherichia coli]